MDKQAGRKAQYGERKEPHSLFITPTAWNWFQQWGGPKRLEIEARKETHPYENCEGL